MIMQYTLASVVTVCKTRRIYSDIKTLNVK